jgi:hypothetical protein
LNPQYFFKRKLAEHAPDPPLVNRSAVVDQREGLLREAALDRRRGGYRGPSPGVPETGTTQTSGKRWSPITSGSLTTMQGLTHDVRVR